MTHIVKFHSTLPKSQDALVVFVSEGKSPVIAAKKINKATKAAMAKAMSQNKQFTGKAGDILTLNGTVEQFSKVFVIGTGKPEETTALQYEEFAGKLVKAVNDLGVKTLVIDFTGIKHPKKSSNYAISAHFALGLKLGSYNFIKFKSKTDKNALKTLNIVTDKPKEGAALYKSLNAIGDGVCLARDLVNEPPNSIYPASYAKLIKKQLAPMGVEVEILNETKMKKLGFGALLSVGQGSARESQTVIMRWNGNKTAKKAPIAFVGKGVTFDTGGISLKPGPDMDLMKMDMGGSATVVGTMKALAGRKAKVNAIGIVGLVENMPSSNAYRPGDIITSHAGKTIEILNTDAEGRLVLADILTYVQAKYKPEVIVDLATLTGAIMVALGFEYCGTFANDNDLWKQIENASQNTGEKFWRMPLDEAYRKEMESDIADLRNLGKTGYGGACSAAGFLEHFINEGVKWAHIDIAGTAWWKSDKPTTPKGGTGFGVRALDDLVQNHFEK